MYVNHVTCMKYSMNSCLSIKACFPTGSERSRFFNSSRSPPPFFFRLSVQEKWYGKMFLIPCGVFFDLLPVALDCGVRLQRVVPEEIGAMTLARVTAVSYLLCFTGKNLKRAFLHFDVALVSSACLQWVWYDSICKDPGYFALSGKLRDQVFLFL